MPRDGINIRLEGGARLDSILSKMRKSVGTRLVNQSLTKGAAEVRKEVKKSAPRAKKDTTGFKLESRNIKKGQLRRAIKSGLRRKMKTDRNTFIAGVWIQDAKGGAKENV
jgi:regulator of protease activity HflC (stomatin/prohibitin superfamily)